MFTLNVSGNTVAELKEKIAEACAGLCEVTTSNAIIDDLKIIPEKPKKIQETIPKVESVMDQLVYMPIESSFEGTDVSDLDKDGLPWDERLNSPLKVRDRHGRWKKKLGVSVEDRFRVIEELKGNVIKTKTPEPEAAPLAPVSPDMNEPAFEVPAPTFVPVPEPMAPPAAPHEPSFTIEHFKNNFSVVMSDLFSTKKLTMEKVQQLCDIARVQQAWQIPLDETSLKAVYNNLVQERLI